MNTIINIPEEIITRTVFTLKQIDVRGYDSMDRLVGLVMMFENILDQAHQQIQQMQENAQEGA